MADTITSVINVITNIMSNFGIFSGFFLVLIESIFPVLPVSVFIALNIITYGSILGFFVSWVATVIGSMSAFYLSKKSTKFVESKIKKNKKIKELRKNINKISFSNLVILFAIPFTPAFPINIAAGMSNMSQKRFIMALIIGKLPMVYFWVFIGKNLTDCLTDISVLAKMIFMIVMAYLVGKVANTFIKE